MKLNKLEKIIEDLKKENAELKRQLEARHKDEIFNKKVEELAIKYADILLAEMNRPIQNILEINDGVRILSHFKQMISKNQRSNCDCNVTWTWNVGCF